MRTDNTGQDSPSEPVTAKSVDREGMARNAADSRNAYKVEGEALSNARSTGGISTPEGAKHVSPAYKQMSPSPAPKKSYNPMVYNISAKAKETAPGPQPPEKFRTQVAENNARQKARRAALSGTKQSTPTASESQVPEKLRVQQAEINARQKARRIAMAKKK